MPGENEMTQYEKRLKDTREEQKYMEELAAAEWGEMAELGRQLQKEEEYVKSLTELDRTNLQKKKENE
jgi:hypothetical protein